MDKIFIKDLLVRSIIGVNPDERVNKQDILINIVIFTDIRTAGKSENIRTSVNYDSVAKHVIKHVEESSDYLVEKLVSDIAFLILNEFDNLERVQVRVEKPSALRYAKSVGIEIERTLADFEE
ncbi:MAG: dihydroneopterin aldolase [Candidatus Promineifilaceae bacterium]|jgi:FolB domain-containing protein